MTIPTGRKFTYVFVAVLLAGLAVAYGNCFNIDFQFDDSHTIVNNPAIRSLRNIPALLSDPSTLTVLRENVDVRPVLAVSYALNYAVSGLRPWSYHLVNLLLHLIACLLVFFIVRDHLWWPVRAGT